MSSVERTASGANPGLQLWWRWVWHRVDVTSHLRHWRSLACQNCNWDKEIYIYIYHILYYIYYLFISTRLSIYYIPTSCDHCILYNFLSRQILRNSIRCFIISHLSFLCAYKMFITLSPALFRSRTSAANATSSQGASACISQSVGLKSLKSWSDSFIFLHCSQHITQPMFHVTQRAEGGTYWVIHPDQ